MQKEINWLLKEKYQGNLPVGRQGQKQFYKDIERLKKGEPLDYVIGFTEFLGCKIDLSKKPLIPRPETEFWVQRAINDILIFSRISECQNKEMRVLDIFAGSGCIGLAVLRNVYCATVIFADNDKNCISQIKINCKINDGLIRTNKGFTDDKRYSIVRSDVFNNIKGKFDFIFANPPYISDYRKNPSARLRAILRNRIQKSVLKYEPKQALFGGPDGLFYIRKFLKQAKNYLNSGGKIFMEFSPEQKKLIEKLLKEYNYKAWEFHKDQYNKYRWVVVFA